MKMLHRIHSQSGFSLLEALIAVLIFSIGVLGVVALQFTSKHANHEAIQRLTATNLVREMAERMRLNRDRVDTYTSAPDLGAGTFVGTDCIANTCTILQLANFDLMEWDQALLGSSEQRGVNNVGGLVQPSGCISGLRAPGVFTITVAWRGSDQLIDAGVTTCNRIPGTLYGTNDEYRRFVSESIYIR